MKQSGRKWLVLLIAVLVALAVLTLTACGFGTPTGDDKEPDGTGGSQKEEIDDLKSDRVSEAEWYDAFDKVFDTPARTANFTTDIEISYLEGDESMVDTEKYLFAGGKIYGRDRYTRESETETEEKYYEYNREDGKWYRYDREESGDWVRSVVEYTDSDASAEDFVSTFSELEDYADYTYNSTKGYYEGSIEEDGVSIDMIVKLKDGNLVYIGAEGTDGADEQATIKSYFYDYGTTKVTLPTIDDGDPDDNNPDDNDPDDTNPDGTNPDDNDDVGDPAKREEIDNTASDRVSEAEWNAAWAKVTTEPMRTANFTVEGTNIYTDGEEFASMQGICQFATGRECWDGFDLYGRKEVFYYGYDQLEGRWYGYRQTDDGNHWLKYLFDYYEPDETVDFDGFDDGWETIRFSDYSYNMTEGCYQSTVTQSLYMATYHYNVKVRDGHVVYMQAMAIFDELDYTLSEKYYFYDYGTTEVSLPTDIANTDGFEYEEVYDDSDGEDIFLGWAISGYHGNDRDLTIPAEFLGDPVVEIGFGHDAFKNRTDLTSVTIPTSVTSIGNYAFTYCSNLTTVTFGANSQLKSIGSYAFNDCSSLTSIEIPSGVTSIGHEAFSGCSSLTSIEIPSSVTSIGDYAFCNCTALTTINYEGTRAEWDAVDRGWDWIGYESAVRIVCTDGVYQPGDFDGGDPGTGPDDPGTGPDIEYTVTLAEALESLPDAVDNLIKAGASGLRDGRVAFDATAYVIYGDINIELRLAASLDKNNSGNNKALIQVKSVDAEGEVSYPVAVYLTNNTVYLYDTITNQVKDAEWFKFEIVDSNGGDLIAELVSVMADFVGRNLSIQLGEGKPAFDLAEKGFFGGSTYGGLVGMAGGILDGMEVGYAKELESGGYTITLDTEALTLQLGELLDSLGPVFGDESGGIAGIIEGLLGDYMGIVDPLVEVILGQSLSAILGKEDFDDFAVYPEIEIILGYDEATGTMTQLGVNYKKAASAYGDAVDLQFGLKDIVIDESGTVTPDVEKSYSSAKTIAATGSLAVQLPAYANSALTKELVLTGYVDFSDIKFSFDTKTYEGVDGAPDVLGMVFEGFNADGLEAFVTATYDGRPIDLGLSYKGSGEFVLDLRGLAQITGENLSEYRIYTQYVPSTALQFDREIEALRQWFATPAQPLNSITSCNNLVDYLIARIKEFRSLAPGEKPEIFGAILEGTAYLGELIPLVDSFAEQFLGIDLDAEEIVIPGVDEDAGTASFTLVIGEVLDFIRSNSIIQGSTETITIAGTEYTLSELLAEGRLVENLIAIYNDGKLPEAQITVADLVAMINQFTSLNIEATTAAELEAELEKVGFTLDAHRNKADGIGAGITAKLGNTVIASVAISFDILPVYDIPYNPYDWVSVPQDSAIDWTAIENMLASVVGGRN